MSDGLNALIIDDEIQIRRFLKISLEANGYRVHEARTGEEGLSLASQLRPDITVLDLGLPDIDGLEVLKRLREWLTQPIIVLSVRSGDKDKIAALDAGADDYVTKPFSMGEFLARLRVAQRHMRPIGESTLFQTGPLTVDLTQHVVTLNREPVKLSSTEYAFLRLLVQHAGQVLTHRQILKEVWGPQYINETHYLRVYMTQLRQKLEADPTQPKLLLTEPGVGYRLHIEE